MNASAEVLLFKLASQALGPGTDHVGCTAGEAISTGGPVTSESESVAQGVLSTTLKNTKDALGQHDPTLITP